MGKPSTGRLPSRRRFLAGSAALLTTGLTGSVSALYTDEGEPDTRPSIIGHRGAAGLAPANTIAAIKRALEYDIDGIELDVRQTRDGTLILFHDPILDWATDGHGRVHTTSWKEISEVRFDGEPIPTLRDGLAILADTEVDLFLEAKRVGYTEAILDVVDEYGLLDRLTLTSFKPAALTPARARGVPIGLLGKMPDPDVIEKACTLDAVSVSSHYVPRAIPWFLEEAREEGLTGGIWQLTETARTIEDAAEADPDYITTNRPDLALATFTRS